MTKIGLELWKNFLEFYENSEKSPELALIILTIFTLLFSFQADISCEATPRGVGSIRTKTNYLTLKYVTDAWGTTRYGFRMVLTAYKNGSMSGGGCSPGRFVCDDTMCIHNDLVCDTVNHCQAQKISFEFGGLLSRRGLYQVLK